MDKQHLQPNKTTPKSTTTSQNHQNPNCSRPRTPLLPSEKDNNNNTNNGLIAHLQPNNKRPKSKQVSSRYMMFPSPSTPSTSTASSSFSSSTSRRCPSPLISRNSSTHTCSNTRSVSVDRKRPLPSQPNLTPKLGNVGEMSAATKLLVTSTRSLSVSFQGEAYALPISKTKTKSARPSSPSANSVRKCTPERRRGNVDHHLEKEKSKPLDQHRWPARISQSTNPLSRSLNYSTEDRKRLIGSEKVIKALQQSVGHEGRRASFDGRLGLSLDNNNAEMAKTSEQARGRNSISGPSVPYDLTTSDSESVSLGSNCGVKPRGIAVLARFWQETNSRLRRLHDPGSPLSNSPAKFVVPPKLGQSKKYSGGGVSVMSSPRTMSSPVKGGIIPSSPSKLTTSSLSRGMPSPSRIRNSFSGTGVSSLGETPSVLSYAVDIRQGKVGENQIVHAHLLRLLYNRQLQWRYANARIRAASLVQKHSAEKNLWNTWITVSDLRDSVTKKRHRLQLLRRKLKLASILKGQMTCLEDWASFEKDHSVSLAGGIEALRASTLRLPVVGGTNADAQTLKDAIGSAADVMQAIASSKCMLSSKAEVINSLVVELARVKAKESALLGQCKGFLSMLASMQVKICSLRTHLLQHNSI